MAEAASGAPRMLCVRCCDRVSDRTLDGDHVGDVQPPDAQLGARISAQECSRALRLVGQRSFDFTLEL
eukprot:7209782-Prymnesium_polylepis.1